MQIKKCFRKKTRWIIKIVKPYIAFMTLDTPLKKIFLKIILPTAIASSFYLLALSNTGPISHMLLLKCKLVKMQ